MLSRWRRGGYLALTMALTACTPTAGDSIPRGSKHDANSPQNQRESLFGERGLNFGGFYGDEKSTTSGIAVNSYLWRGALDTIAFMPLSSADPFGGVIITDWYSPPDTPGERFKINVYILDRQLRSDGIRATVFRQRLDTNNQWAEAPVDKSTTTELENAILSRARQLRVSQPPTS